MRYALIKNGKVENIIKSSPSFIESLESDFDYCILLDGTKKCSIGFDYDGVDFHDNMPKTIIEKTKSEIDRETKHQEIKSAIATFDSKTAAEKWALVKKLIEVL